MNIQQVQDKFGLILNAEKANDLGKAMRLLDEILLKVPDFVPAWIKRGAIHDKVGCSFDAILSYNQAIALVPHEAAAYCNRGAAYLSLGEYDRALNDFDASLERDDSLAECWLNKGNTYRRRMQIDSALNCYRQAIKRNPNYSDAHLGLSMCLLELQQFEEGWKEFEWRFRTDQMPPRGLKYPMWWGQKAHTPNQGLLIYGEQGYGDVLQFIRYAKLAKQWWEGPVYVEVRLPLMRLMQTVDGVDGVVVLGEKIPVNVAAQIPMMSVPAVVGTEKGFVGPYLKADTSLAAHWAQQIKELPDGLRVGLCWAGMNYEDNVVASSIDARRSLSLTQLAPLAQTKGIMWVSLQKGGPAEQAKRPPVGMSIADFGDQLYDFHDTAALISNLDLVITVDTAVAHLAAGLGKPTWMLSRYDGCWRWFGDRPDSPWYPSMRQYRQKAEGEWGPVIEVVWRDLQSYVCEHRIAA